jgi:hypothetical protein
MSAPDPIIGLRPVDGSAAALRDAIARTRAAIERAEDDATRAKTDRDGLLIDGSPAELKAAEAALLAARDGAERFAAMLGQLDLRLAAADRAEMLASVARLQSELDAAEQAVAAWEASTVPGMVEACREGVRLHNVAVAALRSYVTVQDRIAECYPDEPLIPRNSHAPRRNWISQLDDPLRGMLG